MIALRLADDGFDVDVYVAPREDPRTDSQRNHAWLQSGLLYGERFPAARRMYLAGHEMLDSLGLPRPTTRGVFRFEEESEAQAFEEDARRLMLLGQIRRLSDSAASDLLGSFYVSDRIHYEVPDTPFDEALVMEAARGRAMTKNVNFRQSLVRLVADNAAPNGYLMKTDFQTISPRIGIVCAGAGTPSLLRQLDLEHELTVNQSALLVFQGAEGITAPLLADRSSGLSVVRWAPEQIPPHGCLVVGGADRKRLSNDEEYNRRIVDDQHVAELIELLPAALRSVRFRVTAGHKTDYRIGSSSIPRPWIFAPDQFPGLIFATPGKATLAGDVARRVREKAKPFFRTGSSAKQAITGRPPLGKEWSEPIKPHFDSDFEELDERDGDERSGQRDDPPKKGRQ
jgi:hypothetical protein